MTDATSSRVAYSIEIDAPPGEVWLAITDPKWTPKFFHDTAVHSSWAIGAPISYDLPDGVPAIVGRIVEFTAPQRFVMTARFVFDPVAAGENESLLSWEVTPQPPGGALLTLVHDQVPPHTLSIVRGGWPGVLADLHRTLRPGSRPAVVEL